MHPPPATVWPATPFAETPYLRLAYLLQLQLRPDRPLPLVDLQLDSEDQPIAIALEDCSLISHTEPYRARLYSIDLNTAP